MLELRLKIDYRQVINPYRALFKTVIETKYYRRVCLADKIDSSEWVEEVLPPKSATDLIQSQELVCEVTESELDNMISISGGSLENIIKKLYYKALDQELKRQEENNIRNLKELLTKIGG